MVRTPSTMLPLGTKAPDFSLVNVDGRTVSLADFERSAGAAGDLHVQPLSVREAPGRSRSRSSQPSTWPRAWRWSASARTTSPTTRPTRPSRWSPRPKSAATVPLSVRRDAGSGQGVSRRLHARFLPVRRRQQARLSRPVRRQPAGQRHPGHRRRPAGGHRRRARRRRSRANKQRPSIGCNIKWKPGNEPDYFG